MSHLLRTSTLLAVALAVPSTWASQRPQIQTPQTPAQPAQPLTLFSDGPMFFPLLQEDLKPLTTMNLDSLTLDMKPLALDMQRLTLDMEPLSLHLEPLTLLAEAQPLTWFPAEPQHDKAFAEKDPVYADGMKAMDEGRWNDAVGAFDKIAATHSDRSEAALYWKAYSLEKLGKKTDANATCDQLQSGHPQSSWNRECMMLRAQSGVDSARLTAEMARTQADMEVRMADAGRRAADAVARTQYRMDQTGNATWTMYKESSGDPNEEIRLIALNSLMQQEPNKALPALKAYILSNRPVDDRRRALFVLSRSKSPEAQSLLTEIATSNTDPELQRAAVQTIATGRGKQAGPDLLNIYRNSQDKGVKRAAISGLFVAHDASELVDLARAEKDMDLKREIVSQLAIMHDPAATAYMEELLK